MALVGLKAHPTPALRVDIRRLQVRMLISVYSSIPRFQGIDANIFVIIFPLECAVQKPKVPSKSPGLAIHCTSISVLRFGCVRVDSKILQILIKQYRSRLLPSFLSHWTLPWCVIEKLEKEKCRRRKTLPCDWTLPIALVLLDAPPKYCFAQRRSKVTEEAIFGSRSPTKVS